VTDWADEIDDVPDAVACRAQISSLQRTVHDLEKQVERLSLLFEAQERRDFAKSRLTEKQEDTA
jgi:hypothetical protein